jgi:integrase
MPRRKRQNRDGVVIAKKPNGRWIVRVWDRDLRRYRSTSFASEAQALREAQAQRARFDLGQDNAEDSSLERIWTAYRNERLSGGKASARSIVSMERVVEGLRVAGATDFKSRGFRAAVTRYFNTLQLSRTKGSHGRAAVSTRRRMHSQVRALINFATNAGWLPNDPLAGYSPAGDREQDDTAREVFTLAEARALVALNRPADPVWVHAMLMLYAGLRDAEARALTWADVDREARLLWVRKGKGNKVRAVPIQAELLHILAEVSALTGPDAQVACMPSATIVVRKRGRVVCYQLFGALLHDAGIVQHRGIDPITTMPRRLTRHSCRHFFCAALLAAGTPGDQLRIIMGHGSADLTVHYGAQVAMFARAAADEGWRPGEMLLKKSPRDIARG